MGLSFVDIHTVGHFIGGVISRLVIFPNNIRLSFIISNIGHLIIELLEKNKNSNGIIVETSINHLGDILFFLLGWIIANYYYIKLPNNIYYILLIVLLIICSKEILREFYIH